MPEPGDVEAALDARLSGPRAAHCRGVAAAARDLAVRFDVDPRQAVLAGLLHDWYRETPAVDLLALARRCGVVAPGTPDAEVLAGTLHGPVAARLLPERWSDLEPAVLWAIDRHTTGDVDMADLDCVLFVGDMIEPGRSFPGVERLRAAATRDLRAATLAVMDATLGDLLARGRRIAPRALAARNSLLARLEEGGAAGRPVR